MLTLQELVLSKYNLNELINLHQTRPDLSNKEVFRRLSACDLSLLEILDKFRNQYGYSPYIIQGLKNVKKCLPWRIGVIYNYLTGNIVKVEVSIGITGRYTANRKPLLISWLAASVHHMLLRQVVSSSYPSEYNSNITYHLQQDEYSEKITDFLLNSSYLFVYLITLQPEGKTFASEQPLPGSERYQVFPVAISDGKTTFELANTENLRPDVLETVSISFSREVEQYRQIIREMNL